MPRSNWFLSLATTCLVGACAAPAMEHTTTVTTTTTHPHEMLRVRLNDEIRAACPAVATPTFDFDSADADPQHRDALRPLADCMNLPANHARRFVLIGHTDPEGTANYNSHLGMERATSTRDLLVGYGVVADRLDITSRGSAGAVGTPADEWPTERRVEVEFAPAAAATP